MPASSVNVVELVLNMKDTDVAVRQLNDVDKAARGVVRGIKDHMSSMTNTTVEAVKTVANSLESVSDNLFTKTATAAQDVGGWFHSVLGGVSDTLSTKMAGVVQKVGGWFQSALDSVSANYPQFVEGLNTYITTPLHDAYKDITEIGSLMGLGARLYYEDIANQVGRISTVLKDETVAVFGYVKQVAMDAVGTIIDSFPITVKMIEGGWKVAKLAATAFLATVALVPATIIKATRVMGRFAGVAVSAFRRMATAAQVTVKVLKDTGKYIWKNVKAAAAFINKITGIGWILGKVNRLAKITLAVTGITAATGLLRAFFMNANNQFSGLLGGGSAFSIFMDHINAALLPVAAELSRLATQVAPLLVQLLTPLLQFMVRAIRFASDAIEQFVSGSGQFSNFMTEISEVVSSVASIVFQIMVDLGRTLMPILTELLSSFGEMFRQVAEVVFPMIQEFASRIFPVIGQVFRTLAPILLRLFQDLAAALGPIMVALVDAVIPIVEAIVDMLPQLMPAVEDLFEQVGRLLRTMAPLIVVLLEMVVIITTELLAPATLRVLTWIITGIARLAELLSGALMFAVDLLGDNFLGTFREIAQVVGGFFGGLADMAETTIGGLFTFIRTAWGELRDFLGFADLGTEVAGIFGSIVEALRTPYEALTEVINNNIVEPLRWLLSYDLPVLGSLQTQLGIGLPPYLAAGGIITRPTVAVIGEGTSPEAVLPLTPEAIERVAPALLPSEHTTRVVMPDRFTTMHGQTIVDVLTRIEETLTGIQRQAAHAREREPMLTDMPIAFTLRGFS